MFKKRNCKGQNRNTRRNKQKESDDDNDNDDSQSIHDSNEGVETLQERLAATKQRRTLLHQLQYNSKRGVDAHQLLQRGNQNNIVNHSGNDDTTITIVADGSTVESGTSSIVTSADALTKKTQLPGGTVVAAEQKVWDQKHANAMEEYVQQKLQEVIASNTNVTTNVVHKSYDNGGDDSYCINDTENGTSIEEHSTSKIVNSKEQLYRELAKEAAKLSGKNHIDNNINTKIVGRPQQQQQLDTNSSDVHTAGAALAIVEVILPIDERIKAVTATVASASASASATTTTTNVRVKTVVPNRFRSSYNHHHPILPNNNNSGTIHHGVKRTLENNKSDLVESQNVVTTLDDDRLGFAASRQLQQQQSQQRKQNHTSTSSNNATGSSNYSRSIDDRVYQQFMKRQREQHGR